MSTLSLSKLENGTEPRFLDSPPSEEIKFECRQTRKGRTEHKRIKTNLSLVLIFRYYAHTDIQMGMNPPSLRNILS